MLSRLYTAVPTSGLRGPNIQFSTKHNNEKTMKQLDDWWANVSSDPDAKPTEPEVEFGIPAGVKVYPSGDAMLDFVRYDHNRELNEWTVLARLLSGRDMNPTGYVFRVYKGNGPALNSGITHDKEGTEMDRLSKAAADPTRAGRLLMQEKAHAYAIMVMVKTEEAAMRSIALSAYERDEKMFPQAGPDDYDFVADGRIHEFNNFVWIAMERLLRSYVNDPKITDHDLEQARVRLEGQILNLVKAFLMSMVMNEKADKSYLDRRVHVKLPLITRIDKDEPVTPRTRRTPRSAGSTEPEAHARKSYKLTPKDEQDIDAIISSAIFEVNEAIKNGITATAVVGASCCSCANCGCDNTEFRCSRCKSVNYCSERCQNKHWKKHQCECRQCE